MTTPVDPDVRPLQAPNPPGWEPKVRPAPVPPALWRRSDGCAAVVLLLTAAVLAVALWNPWRFVVLSDVVVIVSLMIGLAMIAFLAWHLVAGARAQGLVRTIGTMPIALQAVALLVGPAAVILAVVGSAELSGRVPDALALADPPDRVVERPESNVVVEVRQTGCYISAEGGDGGGGVYLVARRGILSRRNKVADLGWCGDAKVTFVDGRDELILTMGCAAERIAYDPRTLDIEARTPSPVDSASCNDIPTES